MRGAGSSSRILTRRPLSRPGTRRITGRRMRLQAWRQEIRVRLRPHRRRRKPAGPNTGIGRTTITRRPRKNGSPLRPPTQILGGRSGSGGFRNTPAARCRRVTPATASSYQSRTRQAPTSRSGPRISPGYAHTWRKAGYAARRRSGGPTHRRGPSPALRYQPRCAMETGET
jgi:hypothetical protein